jgi:hypothetical protein
MRHPVSHLLSEDHDPHGDPSLWTELYCDWDCYSGPGLWISPNDPDPTLHPIVPNSSTIEQRASDVLAEHVDHVLNPIRTTISLANFLLELEDIKTSTKTLSELIHRINPSNQILNWQLGVKPLIGDIQSLFNLIQNFHKDLDRVLRSQNDPVRITTSRDISDTSTITADRIPPTRSYDTFLVCTYETLADSVTVKFVTWVKYDTSHLSDIALTCKSALRSIGASNPIQVIWNAIPYSFVVDWVVNFSAALKKFDLSTGYIRRQVVRQTSHLKIGKLSNHYTAAFDGGNSDRDIFPDSKVGQTSRSYYRRWVGLPPEWTYRPTGDPSFRELVLSILLGTQQAPHIAQLLHQFPFLRKKKK